MYQLYAQQRAAQGGGSTSLQGNYHQNVSRPVIGSSRIISTEQQQRQNQAPRPIAPKPTNVEQTIPRPMPSLQITPRMLPKFASPGVRPPLFPRGLLHLSSPQGTPSSLTPSTATTVPNVNPPPSCSTSVVPPTPPPSSDSVIDLSQDS